MIFHHVFDWADGTTCHMVTYWGRPINNPVTDPVTDSYWIVPGTIIEPSDED